MEHFVKTWRERGSGNHREAVLSAWVRFNQWLWYRPLRLVTALWFKPVVRQELAVGDLDPALSYIIAANHQSGLDPFVICTQLSKEVNHRLLRFSFMAYNGLFKKWWLRPALSSFGVFPARPFGAHHYGLEASRRYLAAGHTLILFPEGRRTSPQALPARRGIGLLANEPEVMIIPVHIRWRRVRRWQRRLQLVIGKPIDGHGKNLRRSFKTHLSIGAADRTLKIAGSFAFA